MSSEVSKGACVSTHLRTQASGFIWVWSAIVLSAVFCSSKITLKRATSKSRNYWGLLFSDFEGSFIVLLDDDQYFVKERRSIKLLLLFTTHAVTHWADKNDSRSNNNRNIVEEKCNSEPILVNAQEANEINEIRQEGKWNSLLTIIFMS